MANTKSALKAQRQSVKRAARNKSARSAVRTYYKKAALALVETQDTAADAVLAAVINLDRAARKGIIHPNNAARRKSRLMSRLYVLTTATPSEAAAPVAAEAPKRKPAARKPAAATTRPASHASAAARRASVTRTATAGTRRRAES